MDSSKKLKVLFISLNKGYRGYYIPFGVFILEAYISKQLKNVEIKISDYNCDNWIDVFLEFKPDIVGISLSTLTLDIARQAAEQIKKINPKTLIIVGGPHVSALPEHTLNYPFFDVGFLGEAEKPLTEFLKKYSIFKKIIFQKYKVIPGIILKTKKGIFINKKLDYIQNLDEIPYINYAKANLGHYLAKNQAIRAVRPMRTFTMMTSRGCPYNCFFCASGVISRRNVRYNSAKYVIKYIELLYDKYKVKGIYFHDDLFIANKERTKEICEYLIKSGLNKKIKWACQVRTEVVLNSKDILSLIKEAGCVQFEFGFESGNNRILKLLKGCSANVTDNQKAIDLTFKHDIKIYGNFMFGNYSETTKEMQDTIDFIEKNIDKLNFYYVYAANPLPGTDWWKKASFDPDSFDYERLGDNDKNPKSFTRTLSDSELKKYLNKINFLAYQKMPISAKMGWFFNEIFKRPRYVLYRLYTFLEMANFNF